jgi:signal transduction histidine kinase
LHAHADHYRFFARLRAPADPSETRRIERWLATARLFLAISALAAIYMDPTQLGHAPIAYGLLGFYLVHGVLVITLLRRRKQSTPAFRLLVHTADIVWPAFISIFAEGPRSPFFLFFFFVLAAAAYRWGVWETLGTAAAEVVLLWVESVFVRYVGLAPGGALPWHILAGLRVNVAEFEPKRLFMLSVYLLVMGLLLGYLAEQQKQLRTEKSVVALILGKARVLTGLTGTLQEIFREVITLYGAARVLIAAQEVHSHRVFLGEVRCSSSTLSELRWLDFAARDAEVYLYPCAGEVSYGSRERSGWSVLALDDGGNRVQASTGQPLERLTELEPFHSVAAVSFLFGADWRGRVFLFDPTRLGKKQEELRFLQDLVRHVGPAVYNVYLLHRLRRRAEAAERARVARELHDGAVQSLIAVEMQVDVLRRQATAVPGPVSAELGRIQGLLREEVLKLRELMQQMKSIDVDSRKFIGVLHDTVERFRRETGISARFVTDVDELDMPQRVCRELVRIVQEGLVNVRKHSSARHALVRFGASGDQWILTLEDDGKGFPFSGRLTEAEMEQIGKGPMIIKERAHLIAGKLTVESNSGQGARVEVTVPRSGDVIHEF